MWCLTHHLLISFTLYIGLWPSNLQVHSSFFPDCPYVTEAPGAWSLCFLAFDTNQPTSDCVSPRAGLARDWRVGKKKKRQGVSSPCLSLISNWHFIFSMATGSWQFQFQPGDPNSWAFCFDLPVQEQ